MDQWYYQIEGKTDGPITEQRLLRRIVSGRLEDSDLICCEGMKEFISVREFRAANPGSIAKAKALYKKKQARLARRAERERIDRETPQLVPDRNPKLAVGRSEFDAIGSPIRLRSRSLKDRINSQLSGSRESVVVTVRPPSRKTMIAIGAGLPLLLLAGLLFWLAQQSDRQEAQPSLHTASSSASTGVSTVNSSSAKPHAETVPGKQHARSIAESTNQPFKDSVDSTTKPVSKSTPKRPDTDIPDAKPATSVAKPETLIAKPETTSRKPEFRDNTETTASPNTKPTIDSTPVPESGQPKKRIGLKNTDVLVLYQTIEVDRRPKFIVQGLPFDQQLNYVVESEIKVGKVGEHGFREVVQTVVAAKLIDADTMSRAAMETAIKELPGKSFSYKLNNLQEVVDFKPAEGDEPEPIAVEGPLGILDTRGFAITSVIDDDGWLELSQLTFFVPKEQQSWQGQMHHDWDSLGSWEGVTEFKKTGTSKTIQQIDYVLHMDHTPAADDKAAALPFKIDSLDFASETSGGAIQFDTRLGRIESVTETFRVSGELESSILGRKSKMEIKETQTFSIKLNDQKSTQ